MSTYFITDIHGESEKLDSLLSLLKIKPEDKFVFGGDYVDRGANSFQVIETLLELSKTNTCIFLKGNHDDNFWQDVLEEREPFQFSLYSQGAKETIQSYINADKPLDYHKDFFESLKLYHTEDKILYVHGGFNRHETIKETEEKAPYIFYWDRDLWNQALSYESSKKEHPFKMKDSFKKIFIGHSPTLMWNVEIPMKAANIINCDTGCGKWKHAKLSAVNVDNLQVYQSKKIVKIDQIYEVLGHPVTLNNKTKNKLFKVTKFENKDLCYGTYINPFNQQEEQENCLLNIERLL